MSFEHNYCSPEILDLMLFHHSAFVIKHFEYRKAFDNVFTLLEPFYRFEDLDARNFNQPDFLPLLFQQILESEKKTYFFLPIDDPKVLDVLKSYPSIPFLCIQQDPTTSYDFSSFQKWAIYNNKTHEFEDHSPEDLLESDSLSFKWVSKYLIPKIETSLVEAQNYLALIYNTMESVLALSMEHDEIPADKVMMPFDITERAVIYELTERYFQVKLPSTTIPKMKSKTNQKEQLHSNSQHSEEEIQLQELMTYLDTTLGSLAPSSKARKFAHPKVSPSIPSKSKKPKSSKKSQKTKDSKPIKALKPSFHTKIFQSAQELCPDLPPKDILPSWEEQIDPIYQTLAKKYRCTPDNINELTQLTQTLLLKIKHLLPL